MGTLLAKIELLVKFDPLMNEHVRRVKKKEISDHYLSKDIQNELIVLIADQTLKAII